MPGPDVHHAVFTVLPPPRGCTKQAAFDRLASGKNSCHGGDFTSPDTATSQLAHVASAAAATAAEKLQGRGKLPIRLVGFSKGGVVLNQYLAELAACAGAAPHDSLTSCPVANHATSAERAAGSTAGSIDRCPSLSAASPACSTEEAAAAAFNRDDCVSTSRQIWERGHVPATAQAALNGTAVVPPNGGVGRAGAVLKSGTTGSAAFAFSHTDSAAEQLLRSVTELHFLDVGLNCRYGFRPISCFPTGPLIAGTIVVHQDNTGSVLVCIRVELAHYSCSIYKQHPFLFDVLRV